MNQYLAILDSHISIYPNTLQKIANINVEREQCKLLGPFGIFVQCVLGIFCFSTLMLKQLSKKHRRPWKIWSMDTSKQAIGSFYMHMINVIFSQYMLKSAILQEKIEEQRNNDSSTEFLQQKQKSYISLMPTLVQLQTLSEQNACSWYLVNYLMDVIFCTLLNFLFVQLLINVTKNNQKLKFNPGNYGINTSFSEYAYQLIMWIMIISIDKSIMMQIVMKLQNQLSVVGEFLLKNIHDYPHIELVVVMVIIPSIFNSICFWITDNFLRAKNKSSDKSFLEKEDFDSQDGKEGKLQIESNNNNNQNYEYNNLSQNDNNNNEQKESEKERQINQQQQQIQGKIKNNETTSCI